MLERREGKGLTSNDKARSKTLPSAAATTALLAPCAGTGTILAFDFGEKFTGVAVGEPSVRVAHPIGLIAAESNAQRMYEIAALVAEWNPGSLVVGLPFSLDGEEYELTRRCRRFARQLESRFRLPVSLVDERLSSTAAEEALRAAGKGGRKHKLHVHQVSAQIILQSYLDDPGSPRS